jgi:uncharacterized membrane protein
MLVAVLAAVAAAIAAVTFLQTLTEYRTLPDGFPMHLDMNGQANAMGPRWMAFLVPGIQIGVLALMAFSAYAIAIGAPETHGSLLGLTIIAVCVAVLTWRVQQMLIASAKSGGKPVPMRGFWTFFAVWVCVVLFDAFVIG